jgi:NodT family efflux transporter outer membrane factor (OMF) lipoprotein
MTTTMHEPPSFALPRSLALLLALALPVGCAVGPDFHRLAAPQVDRYTADEAPPKTTSAEVKGGEAQSFVREMDIPGEWWTLFHSKALDDLIARAIATNPDMEAAQAAVRNAMQTAAAQRGTLFPTVDASFSPTRQKLPSTLASPLASGSSVYSLHTAQVSVGYTVDAFGGAYRQIESLEAQADYQRFELEAAYLTLTSNVVAAAVTEAQLRGEIAAVRRLLEIQEQSLGLLRQQYEAGQVAEVDVLAQEAALAQTRMLLPPLAKQLDQERDLLARLAGRFPSETLGAEFELASLDLPEELPLSLPAKLVEQRPDVRAAEELVHSANADVGVAIAARLPSITLSADLGLVASAVSELFSSGAGFWAVGGNVAQPVFQGGTLLHRQHAAEAALAQALAQYRGTVLTAFQNVADTLHAIKSDAESLRAALDAERAASKSLAITRSQLALGDVSYLALLNAEQTYQQAVMAKVQALASRYADTAALFQALGGGWWNRSKGEPEAMAAKP